MDEWYKDIKNDDRPTWFDYNVTVLNNKNKAMGFYEEIFNREYKGKSSVYSDIEWAIKRLGLETSKEREMFFFTLIGLERVKVK